MSTVRLSGVSFSYGRRPVLREVSLSLGTGVTGLLGPNGSGKTTLLRVLATALPAAGGLEVLGQDPGTAAGRLAIRRRLGYVPQDPGFHERFTAFEFVDYVAILKEWTDRGRRHEEVRRVLEVVGLAAQRRVRIKALSGGMRRRVSLACALLGDPRLLVLDEPMVGLDPEQRLRYRETVAGLGARSTVVLSTHQTEDVMSLCSTVVVLVGGRVLFRGAPAELAAVARGAVWRTDGPVAGAVASVRYGDGSYRSVARRADGGQPQEPTVEEGYLLLLAGAGTEAAA